MMSTRTPRRWVLKGLLGLVLAVSVAASGLSLWQRP